MNGGRIMVDELKSCPFCGKEVCVTRGAIECGIIDYSIFCWNCWHRGGIHTGTRDHETRQEAVDAWNRRTASGWTAEPPTEPGLYWLLVRGKTVVAEVGDVFEPAEEWRVNVMVGRENFDFLGSLRHLCEMEKEIKWCKINPPAEQ